MIIDFIMKILLYVMMGLSWLTVFLIAYLGFINLFDTNYFIAFSSFYTSALMVFSLIVIPRWFNK